MNETTKPFGKFPSPYNVRLPGRFISPAEKDVQGMGAGMSYLSSRSLSIRRRALEFRYPPRLINQSSSITTIWPLMLRCCSSAVLAIRLYSSEGRRRLYFVISSSMRILSAIPKKYEILLDMGLNIGLK